MLFTLIISLFVVSTAYCDEPWVHITTNDAIKIYAKKVASSPLRALRAEGMVDGKIENIVAILRNVKSATKWVPNLIERTDLESPSDVEVILYDITDMPWPLKDRDSVVHYKLSMSKDKKSLVLNFKSVDHSKMPLADNRVRAIITYGILEFSPRGDKTFARLTMLVDPMGKIPKWAVNLVQVRFPYDFLMSLNEYAPKTQLKPLPKIQKMIDQLIRD